MRLEQPSHRIVVEIVVPPELATPDPAVEKEAEEDPQPQHQLQLQS
jgi:hypothetical protein